MPMSCHAEVSSYQSWVIANRKNVVAISVRHIRLSLAHLFEVLAALSIFAFLLRPRRLCTRHPFLFNCKHHFPLVQPHYNNQKSPCQHPENRIATRFSQKKSSIISIQYFCLFWVVFNNKYSAKKFFKKFFNALQFWRFSGVILPHVAIQKEKRGFTRLSKPPP